MKIYLGGPMFTYAEVRNNLRLAKKLIDNGFEVYCPNENDSINDKTRTDITAEKVYLADVKELESANVFLCQVAEDSGTMWEAGYMDCLSKYVDSKKYIGAIGLAVFCKTFLHKIAKTFCRSLQLHFVGNCKPGWQSWYLPAI